jgi:hypothetical protein
MALMPTFWGRVAMAGKIYAYCLGVDLEGTSRSENNASQKKKLVLIDCPW